MSAKTRKRPNVLITGTPGTGKSTIAPKAAENLGFEFVDVSHIIKENEFFEGHDEQYDTQILDEDKLLDFLQEKFDSDEGGLIADYHSSELFPERWFDFVFILRCGTTVLYDRLAARNYQQSKIQQNIECEIFGIVAEEAKEAYKEEIVHELSNETLEDRDKNIRTITELVAQHKRLR